MKSRRRIACPEAQDHVENEGELQQGFAACGMGVSGRFALQKFGGADVSCGSNSEVAATCSHVRSSTDNDQKGAVIHRTILTPVQAAKQD